VQAIYEGDSIPEDKQHWIAINAERAPNLPVIDEKQEPLPTAEARKAALGF
jgi:ferredoxin